MPMNPPVKEPDKRRVGLFAIAIFLLLMDGAVLLFAGNNTALRSVGGLALIISMICLRKSQNYTQRGLDSPGTQRSRPLVVAHLKKLVVTISIILVPLLGTSYAFLYYNVMRGGHQIWPLYVLAVIISVCALFWSLLAAMSL
jgi:hypothetical protein